MSIYAAKIAKLEAALASGVLTIESDGERLTYKSREDLEGAIGYFRRQEAGAGGGAAGRLAGGGTTIASFERD